MKPKIPNTKKPPIIPIRIMEELIFVILETKIGFKRFSIKEDKIPKKVTPIAAEVFPATNR